MGRAKGKPHKEFSPQLSKNIEIKPVDWLKPYERNARTHSETQLDELAASIAEFGFTNPILAGADGTIIAGHGRLEAAKTRLDLKEVPVVILDYLTDAQRRAYIIADNKLALNAGWDEEILTSELTKLEAEGYDLSLTGFDELELDDLFPELPGVEPEEEQEENTVDIEPPARPVTSAGDIWVLGRHKLICADSTKKESYEALMGTERAELVFTDPPYGVDYEGITNDDRKGLEKLLFSAFKCLSEVAHKGAAAYVFHSDKCADIFHSAFRKYCYFSTMLIWKKPSIVLSQGDYHSIHEPFFYGWFKDGSHKWHGDRTQRTIWEFAPDAIEGHTTPKPVDLICRALQNSSVKDAIVLDPFGGSGSTLIACERERRKGRLIELEPKYCDVIVLRWQKETGQKAVLFQSGKTFYDMKAARHGKEKSE